MDGKKISAVILAAGKGTRMKSALPKVLHPVAGMPMITYPLSAFKMLQIEDIRCIVGYNKDLVRSVVEPLGVSCHVQEVQMGTGHAVQCADISTLNEITIIVNGDHPLLTAEDLQKFYDDFVEQSADMAILTVELSDPKSFGRIVREDGEVKAIIELKDASAEVAKIKEINTGIFIVKSHILKEFLPKLSNSNQQNEYYLTDIVEMCIGNKLKVIAHKGHQRTAFGVNSQRELAQATKSLFKSKVNQLMDDGVIVIDPDHTYIEPTVSVGPGTVINPGVYLKGICKIGALCVIEPNVQIHDSQLEDMVQIRAGSYLEQCKVKSQSVVGPYARLRPQTEIGENCRVGNFVEMKKVKFGDGSKANHLAYLGDADVGKEVNVGCGTITCNYAVDKKKYKTEIGDGVFVGSDVQLVAPVKVGNKAVIGSGTTVTKDVPEKALAVGRAKQLIKEGYVKD